MKPTPRELRLLAKAAREAFMTAKADKLLTNAELHKLKDIADKTHDEWLQASIALLEGARA